ncbi:mechanosensitive ion channel family protein [Chryseobacterium hagamense]|uniref:Mechanosensitive ion channel protein MscS n=1 Tax=Chryseobacterium hagamense TaxID=395935 RepID=A0A511YSN8_9FLAO|nr:mechanosensitive ion channel domain-containing protein [Chryseobacterium hagamense]GEN78209.1 mechanosensitive ion channel protein MscS [Chryseobacterium hagamense]
MLSINEQTSTIYDWTLDLSKSAGLNNQAAQISTVFILLISLLFFLLLVDYMLRFFLNSMLLQFIRKTNDQWGNYLVQNKILTYLTRLILTAVTQQLIPVIFNGFPSFNSLLYKILSVLILFFLFKLLNGLLKTGRDILRTGKAFANKPVDSYLQVLQIFLIFILITLTVSIFTGSSPWSFLVSLGAASAVLMLVFKDTILGFVASIQVSANDSVRVGDWIEMPKYGVDGDILEINLNNVRVQNFDKTIVTIPTYTLLSDSFKNYRGMQDTGGRRLKRAIHVKISTIRYLEEADISELKKIALLNSFIEEREQQIREYNSQHNFDTDIKVNGRRMTNIGLFRKYITFFSKSNPDVNQEMTLMVRQLPSTSKGLPLELYMFTNGTDWVFYEDTMSDIFDHLFAAIRYFDLEVFEEPSSDDLRGFIQMKIPDNH